MIRFQTGREKRWVNRWKGKCVLFTADQPSETGSFCIGEATHPQHVPVIGRCPPFNHHIMSAPSFNRCINTIFSLRYEVNNYGLEARCSDHGRHRRYDHPLMSIARLRCTDTDTLLSAQIRRGL